jgi:hypothetical protein
MWNHTLTTPTVAGKKVDWPMFSSQEMADLIAMLQSLGQSPRAR